MTIDNHTHLGYSINKKTYTPEHLLASMKQAGIDYSLLIANYDLAQNTGLKTDQVIAIAEKYPQIKAIGAIEIDTFSKEQIKKLINSLETKKIVGIKFFPGYDGYYPNDERFIPLYDFCQKAGYPVMYHSGFLETGYGGDTEQAHPKHIETIAQMYPELTIVIAHLGNPWIADCARIVTEYKHVYTDVSALNWAEYTSMTKEHIKETIDAILEYKQVAGDLKKCIFGTDYPIYFQDEYLQVVLQVPFTEEEKEFVFWKNANQIFHLEITADTHK